jgi:cold shock CspA family protein
MAVVDDKLTRVGIFYDGNFFLHVSNYYSYHHERRSRVSVSGLHDFIRETVAELEGADERFCRIVDAHYFRGRLRAGEADDRDLLYRERVFDDVLVREGVTTHYLPLSRDGEKGIDVWLALEAYELTLYKHFDVVALVACDGDFLPLVRKLNTLGTRVMVLGWDFRFIDANGVERETRTAQVLLDAATYAVQMNVVIEDRSRQNDQTVRNLFVPRREYVAGPSFAPPRPPMPPGPMSVPPPQTAVPLAPVPPIAAPVPAPMPPVSAPMPSPAPTGTAPGPAPISVPAAPPAGTAPSPLPPGAIQLSSPSHLPSPLAGMTFRALPSHSDNGMPEGTVEGTIHNIKNGYGFVIPDDGGSNIFFYHLDVVDGEFYELKSGDRVWYVPGVNDRGPCARQVRLNRQARLMRPVALPPPPARPVAAHPGPTPASENGGAPETDVRS